MGTYYLADIIFSILLQILEIFPYFHFYLHIFYAVNQSLLVDFDFYLYHWLFPHTCMVVMNHQTITSVNFLHVPILLYIFFQPILILFFDFFLFHVIASPTNYPFIYLFIKTLIRCC